MKRKVCSKCKVEKDIIEFSPLKVINKFHSWCKACKCLIEKQKREINIELSRQNEQEYRNSHPEQQEKARRYAEKYRKENPELVKLGNKLWREANPQKCYEYIRIKRYKMSQEKYNSILTAQGGKCACCGTTEPGGRGAFHVDHDHNCCKERSCGKCIRGLLCNGCNAGLGFFKDNIATLEQAIMYLSRFQTANLEFIID